MFLRRTQGASLLVEDEEEDSQKGISPQTGHSGANNEAIKEVDDRYGSQNDSVH